MPRPLSLLFPVLALGLACTEEPLPPSHGLVIESPDAHRPYFYDFGSIDDGVRPTHTFILRNTDPNPVTLHDVLASCSCAVPSIRVVSPSGAIKRGNLRSDGPVCIIPPSSALEVEIAIDTSRIRRKNSDRLSSIRLRTDSPVTPFHTLEVHVKVQQLIQATPWEINLGEIATSEGGTGHTDVIVAVQDAEVYLRKTRSLSEHLTTSFREERPFGRTLWIVDVHLEPGLPLGPWEGSIKLSMEAPAYEPQIRSVVIPVRARIVGDIVLRPRRVFLMHGSERPAEFTVEALVPGTRFKIESATMGDCPPGAFVANVTPIAPDIEGRSATWKITVSSTGVRPSTDLNARLTLTLDEGQVLEASILSR